MLKVHAWVLHDQCIRDLIEVACIPDTGLEHCALVLIYTCEVKQHVCTVTFAQHNFWIQFLKKFPASLSPRDVVLHTLALADAETARRFAVLS